MLEGKVLCQREKFLQFFSSFLSLRSKRLLYFNNRPTAAHVYFYQTVALLCSLHVHVHVHVHVVSILCVRALAWNYICSRTCTFSSRGILGRHMYSVKPLIPAQLIIFLHVGDFFPSGFHHFSKKTYEDIQQGIYHHSLQERFVVVVQTPSTAVVVTLLKLTGTLLLLGYFN